MSVFPPPPTVPVLDGCSQSLCVQGEGVGVGEWEDGGVGFFCCGVAVSGCRCVNI